MNPKDPRYKTAGKAVEVKSNYYDRDPYPKYFEQVVEPNAPLVVQYQNGTEELSEIKRIRMKGHPDISVAVTRTKDNQDQGVFEKRRIGDLPVIDGWRTIEFRGVSADVPLIIEKNQTVKIEFEHALVGNQVIICDIDKQAVRFYLAR
jgi:hypothetical protein